MLDSNASLKDIIDVFEQIDSKIIDRGLEQTITPSTTNKVLAKGNYRGDITVKGDANLTSANIAVGKSIFGVSGSAKPRIASGSYSAPSSSTSSYQRESPTGTTYLCYVLSLTGLAFQPRVVVATCDYVHDGYPMRSLAVFYNNRILLCDGSKQSNTPSREEGAWVNLAYNNYGVTLDSVRLPLQYSGTLSRRNWSWIAYE